MAERTQGDTVSLDVRLKAYAAAASILEWPLPRVRDERVCYDGARSVDTLLARVARGRGALDIAIGEALNALSKGDRVLRLGYSCIGDYAREVLGIAASTAQKMARFARKLQDRPLLRAAVWAGEVTVREAEAALPVAYGEAEAAWVERARVQTVRALKNAAARFDEPERDWLERETAQWAFLGEPEPVAAPEPVEDAKADVRALDAELRRLAEMRHRWGDVLGHLAMLFRKMDGWRRVGFSSSTITARSGSECADGLSSSVPRLRRGCTSCRRCGRHCRSAGCPTRRRGSSRATPMRSRSSRGSSGRSSSPASSSSGSFRRAKKGRCARGENSRSGR